ncbi:MAG: phosphopantothenoylcysteine decarboxylase [Gammaproteobacteria bacterium GWE2_37_16]|nr:MAG: phosphopantothenoylcysteine decarboxylase [Gammaproteobacteria bacterium GWE2_37_16]
MNNLKGKKIILGVTGGIAAYKTCELIRLLVKNGAEVRVVMTESAQEFITPLTLETLAKNKVYTTTFEKQRVEKIEHISLANWGDCILIAPATANIIAKITHGIADDLLSTMCLATPVSIPILIAPAMNAMMWSNEATQDNIQILKLRKNIRIFGPGEGLLACGVIGAGRMLEPGELAAMTAGVFVEPLFLGKKIIVTAGPTRERIDPVRFISNDSSGKMGYAIAEAASNLGAEVILISGPTEIAAPKNVKKIDIITAEEMNAAVMNNIEGCDVFVAAAAVADYRVEQVNAQKIKKNENNQNLMLSLVRNPDILANVACLKHPPLTVGFAAETENVIVNAKQKLASKKIDIIAANLVGDGIGFNNDQNALTVLTRLGESFEIPEQSKSSLAYELMRIVADFSVLN